MNRLQLLFSPVWDFVRPLIARFMTANGRKLAEAAIEAVRLMEESELPGLTRLAHATAMIREVLRKEGIEFLTHEIHGAIHTALIRIRS